MTVRFYDSVSSELIKYAVIASKEDGIYKGNLKKMTAEAVIKRAYIKYIKAFPASSHSS